MKTGYKTELGKSYMILDGVENEESFAVQMLEENHIQGLLYFEKRCFNGQLQFFYEVTDMHSLAERISQRPLTEKDVRRLLQGLYCVLEEIHSYFLASEGLLLQMEYIYETHDNLFFCYYPAKERNSWKASIEMFAEKLLDQIDKEDDEALELVYQFYAAVRDAKKGILYILEEVLTKSKSVPVIEEEPIQKQMVMNEISILKETEENATNSPDMCTIGCFLLSFLGSVCCFFIFPVSAIQIQALHVIAGILLLFSVAGVILGWTDIDIKRKK